MSHRPPGANSPSNSSKPTSTRANPGASKFGSSSTPLPNFEETPQSPAEPKVSIAQATSNIVVTGSAERETRSPEQSQDQSTSSQEPAIQSEQQDSITESSNMSSAGSSPGNTSTSGSSSGSNVQLPYAPFPYPIPANTRGGK